MEKSNPSADRRCPECKARYPVHLSTCPLSPANRRQAADRRIPPMGGLALMAWRLACYRAYGEDGYLPVAFLKPRAHVTGQISVGSANDWFWNIAACVESGHQWRAEKEFASCGRCHNIKAMRDFKPGEYHRGY